MWRNVKTQCLERPSGFASNQKASSHMKLAFVLALVLLQWSRANGANDTATSTTMDAGSESVHTLTTATTTRTTTLMTPTATTTITDASTTSLIELVATTSFSNTSATLLETASTSRTNVTIAAAATNASTAEGTGGSASTTTSRPSVTDWDSLTSTSTVVTSSTVTMSSASLVDAGTSALVTMTATMTVTNTDTLIPQTTMTPTHTRTASTSATPTTTGSETSSTTTSATVTTSVTSFVDTTAPTSTLIETITTISTTTTTASDVATTHTPAESLGETGTTMTTIVSTNATEVIVASASAAELVEVIEDMVTDDRLVDKRIAGLMQLQVDNVKRFVADGLVEDALRQTIGAIANLSKEEVNVDVWLAGGDERCTVYYEVHTDLMHIARQVLSLLVNAGSSFAQKDGVSELLHAELRAAGLTGDYKVAEVLSISAGFVPIVAATTTTAALPINMVGSTLEPSTASLGPRDMDPMAAAIIVGDDDKDADPVTLVFVVIGTTVLFGAVIVQVLRTQCWKVRQFQPSWSALEGAVVTTIGIGAVTTLLASMVQTTPQPLAIGLAALLGSLCAYTFMLQSECELISRGQLFEHRTTAMEEKESSPLPTGPMTPTFEGAPTGLALPPTCVLADADPTTKAVLTASLLSDYVQIAAQVKKYQERHGILTNSPKCDPNLSKAFLSSFSCVPAQPTVADLLIAGSVEDYQAGECSWVVSPRSTFISEPHPTSSSADVVGRDHPSLLSVHGRHSDSPVKWKGHGGLDNAITMFLEASPSAPHSFERPRRRSVPPSFAPPVELSPVKGSAKTSELAFASSLEPASIAAQHCQTAAAHAATTVLQPGPADDASMLISPALPLAAVAEQSSSTIVNRGPAAGGGAISDDSFRKLPAWLREVS